MEKIRIRRLSKRYGTVLAADCVSLDVQDREFFSLLGPSGCGKTTILRCLAGLEEPTGGEIYIGQTQVNGNLNGINVPTEERPIGMVFQNYAVWPHMTVRQNVAYPLKLKGLPKATIEKRLEAALNTVGLEKLANRHPSELSGGEQQRVALARALIKEPEVLLLDEPLSNLDAKLREVMRLELKQLQRRAGIPILYVTHDQAEALSMSDRLAVMNAGQIIQIGTPAEVYGRPVDRFVADFIGLMNFLKCCVVAHHSGKTIVQLSEGTQITVSDPNGHRDRCTLAVRPEDITLDRAGPIRCKVEIRSYLGNLIEYRVRAGDEAIRVQTPSTMLFNEGEQLGLTIHKAMLFAL